MASHSRAFSVSSCPPLQLQDPPPTPRVCGRCLSASPDFTAASTQQPPFLKQEASQVLPFHFCSITAFALRPHPHTLLPSEHQEHSRPIASLSCAFIELPQSVWYYAPGFGATV